MYLLNRQQLIRHAEDTTSNYLTIYNFLKKIFNTHHIIIDLEIYLRNC
jgi:hypothetical protein